MTEQDLLRQEVLAKLAGTPKVEEKVQPIIDTKEEGESLVEATLKHRLGVENKDTNELDEHRNKIIESVDCSLIERIMNPRL